MHHPHPISIELPMQDRQVGRDFADLKPGLLCSPSQSDGCLMFLNGFALINPNGRKSSACKKQCLLLGNAPCSLYPGLRK